ncbi:acyl carrier protein [Kitasatospora sp. NBC_00240]|uniref:acyl carrier protein n=1 Tax=Kitasatospora sp. NBC_00240 TaxID=2903567 RepID=UPI00224F1631|nr:acyl carrier protein [Kitasatospora sp. NBC_00240]MCX5214612.1 acyl carrier protein [Kitasatospora sp. NBC_00240]
MTDNRTAVTVPAELRAALAALTSEACDGELSAAELLAAAGTPFVLLGVGSLAQLRLLDAVESAYGVLFDLTGPVGFPAGLDALAENLAIEHGVTRPVDAG